MPRLAEETSALLLRWCQLKSAKSLDPVFKLAFDVIPLVNTIYSLLPFYCVCFAFYRISIPFT